MLACTSSFQVLARMEERCRRLRSRRQRCTSKHFAVFKKIYGSVITGRRLCGSRDRLRAGRTPAPAAVNGKTKVENDVFIQFGFDIDAQFEHGASNRRTDVYRTARKVIPTRPFRWNKRVLFRPYNSRTGRAKNTQKIASRSPSVCL